MGTSYRPEGIFYRNRISIIKSFLIGYSDIVIARLAKNTAYLGGDALVEVMRKFKETGSMPSRCFDPDSLAPIVNPKDGRCYGVANNPFQLCGILGELGFDAYVTTETDARRYSDALVKRNLAQSSDFYIFATKV